MADEMPDWYRKEINEVLSFLESGREGLSNEEARRRLALYGPLATA